MKTLQNIILFFLVQAFLIFPTKAVSTIVGNIPDDKIRNGNFDINDVPTIIKGAINFAMGIAWGIAVIFIIIGAYHIMLWDIATEKSKWKEIIMKAIGGFCIAALAWVIIKLIVDNLG